MRGLEFGVKHRDLGCAARPATTPGIERLVSGIVYKGHTSALCLPGSKTMRTCYDITQPPAFPADAPTPASNLPFQPIVCTVSTVRICEHRAVCEVVRRVVHHPGCDFLIAVFPCLCSGSQDEKDRCKCRQNPGHSKRRKLGVREMSVQCR